MAATALRLFGRPGKRLRRAAGLARRRLGRWRKRIWRTRRPLGAAPAALRIGLLAALALPAVAAANLVYQVANKPTELLFPLGNAFDKLPAETWRQYGPLFRRYSTAAVSPELLAALAQVESAGNPLAHTYWRWRLTWHPFAIYAPASSAVGMYQMTDAAFAEARRYCIRDHRVVADGCWWTGLYTRILPSHAVALTAIYLDRNVAAVLGDRSPPASPRQTAALAALIHLCGTGPAKAYLRHGFRLAPGERCGDHDPARYLARVAEMEQEFRRLAEGR